MMCRLTTMCSVVNVSRWACECEGGHQHAHWDATTGLMGRYMRCVAETMYRLSARLDFREATEELEHHGGKVSHTTL